MKGCFIRHLISGRKTKHAKKNLSFYFCTAGILRMNIFDISVIKLLLHK